MALEPQARLPSIERGINTETGSGFVECPAEYDLMTNTAGTDFGLKLLLVVNQSDYLVTASPAAGFMVSLFIYV